MEVGRGKIGATMNLALVAAALAAIVKASVGQGMVPGVMIFGDSVVDAGNNNNLATLVRANFLPYGRDFAQHTPTGRFCNGKLATDFTVENLGFTSYPPAYLSNEATGNNILNGANFASAASGYLNSTANLYVSAFRFRFLWISIASLMVLLWQQAIPLTQQVQYYKEFQSKVEKLAGRERARSLFSGSIYILSAGNSDYIQNYYINPLLGETFTPDQFSDLLVQSFTSFIQVQSRLGARRIGVTSLPPMGCLPAAITLFGGGNNSCVTRLNNDAVAFNKKINMAAESLKRSHGDLRLVIFDIYKPLLDLINNQSC